MDRDQRKDLKMKGKAVKEEQGDELKNCKMKRKLGVEKELKIPTIRLQKPTVLHSMKRTGKRSVGAVIDEPLMKLVEETVAVYGNYIDHIIAMAIDRFRDEKNWHFDSALCEELANVFAQKIRELEGMIKKDLNYSTVHEIVKQLGNMHELFHWSPNINASAMPNCTKQQLMSCHNELRHIKIQLQEITSRIRQLKTNNAMVSKHKNLRILK